MQYKEFYAQLYENVPTITEGVDDPAAFKAVLLMGGPGSGKSYTSSNVFGIPDKINFSAQGLKLIGADIPFEYLLRKNNIPLDLAAYFDTVSQAQQDKVVGTGPNSLRSQAQRIKDFQMKQAEDSGLGFIYDSTAKDPQETIEMIRHLKSKGYDVSVLFVDTPLDVAIARNNARPRKLPEKVVRGIHAQLRSTLDGVDFEKEGANYFRVNNDDGVDATQILQTKIGRAIKQAIESPLQNPVGRELVKTRVGAAVTRSTDRRLGRTKKNKPTTPAEKRAKYEEILKMPIKNPKTGKIIQVGTVVSQGETHPAYRQAMVLIKQHMARR
jgi:predicted kinase